MNKAFEKILEMLEENQTIVFNLGGGKPKQSIDYSKAVEIVQEVAEEYKSTEYINCSTDTSTNGWIACSERLPDNDKKQYIVQKTNGFIDILGFTKDAYKLSRYDFAEYKGKKKQLFYDYDSEYGYIEWECEAWQPLPEPFKERD